MRCTFCGENNPDGAERCTGCGAPLQNQDCYPTSYEPQAYDAQSGQADQPQDPAYQQPPYDPGYQQPPYDPNYQQAPYDPNYQQPPYGQAPYQQAPPYAQTPYPPQPYSPYNQPISALNRWLAFVLCLLLGGIGVHRFYAGKIGTGILYLFTGGLCGVGWLVDIIMIACGSFTDSAGLPLKQ